MNIGSSSSSTAASVDAATDVKVINSQKKQLQAVVGTLLEGIANPPRLEGQTGQRLNVAA